MFSGSILHGRSAPTPRVPGEIVDAVIDRLSTHPLTLGICALVCSEWLRRSRFHSFSTVHLLSWRIHRFKELISSPNCTFMPYISRIEVDGSSTTIPSHDVATVATVCDLLSLSQQLRFSRVESIRLQNIDWTAFSPQEKINIAHRLAEFADVTRLEFYKIVFHDMRDLVRLLASFPAIRQSSVDHVLFTKFVDQTTAAASSFRLPSTLEAVELGKGDELLPFLTCLAAHSLTDLPTLRTLRLKGLTANDVTLLTVVLRVFGPILQNLTLVFRTNANKEVTSDNSGSWMDLGDLTSLRSLDLEIENSEPRDVALKAKWLKDVNNLRFSISTLRSDELEHLALVLHPTNPTILSSVDWHLKEILSFPRLNLLASVRVNLAYNIEDSPGDKGGMLGASIRRCLFELEDRGTLRVNYMVDMERSEIVGVAHWAVLYGYHVPNTQVPSA